MYTYSRRRLHTHSGRQHVCINNRWRHARTHGTMLHTLTWVERYHVAFTRWARPSPPSHHSPADDAARTHTCRTTRCGAVTQANNAVRTQTRPSLPSHAHTGSWCRIHTHGQSVAAFTHWNPFNALHRRRRMHTHRERSTTGTDGTTVLCHTAYVWYGFIPVPVMPEVSAGGGTVSKNGTHGIPVKYPTWALNLREELDDRESAARTAARRI